MEKVKINNEIENVLNEWDLSCSEEKELKEELAAQITDRLVKLFAMPVVRHSCDMITEEYVYKNDFRFQRTQRHGIWFVTYQNHLITFGQYRSDLEEWINSNYA